MNWKTPVPLRKEDTRFLTGKGRFISDITMDGMHHVYIVRSEKRMLKSHRLNAKMLGFSVLLQAKPSGLLPSHATSPHMSKFRLRLSS